MLVRGLAHKMNNILTLFHGYLGLLMDNKQLDAETQAGLRKIKEGAKSASDLVERTHTLVRPPGSAPREIDVAEMARSMKLIFSTMAPEGCICEVRTADQCPRVAGDAGRIKTAMMELLKNAFDAAGPKGTVSLKVGPVDGANGEPDQWLSIIVEDTGAGVPAEMTEKIFQPFFTTKKKNATGLGLNLAKTFIEQHGGRLSHARTEGITRFEIRLPACVAASI